MEIDANVVQRKEKAQFFTMIRRVAEKKSGKNLICHFLVENFDLIPLWKYKNLIRRENQMCTSFITDYFLFTLRFLSIDLRQFFDKADIPSFLLHLTQTTTKHRL